MNPNFSSIFRGRYLPIICAKHLSTGSIVLNRYTPLPCVQSNVSEIYKPNLQFIRNKYKKHQSWRMEEESGSESDDDNEDNIPDKGAKTITVKVTSLRTDLIIKSGLAVARNKVENIFYESRIRLNGKKIYKKSERVNVGDEIDVIRNVSPMNPNFIVVSRIEILAAKAEEERINVKLRRTKTLIIENYAEPWKESSGNS